MIRVSNPILANHRYSSEEGIAVIGQYRIWYAYLVLGVNKATVDCKARFQNALLKMLTRVFVILALLFIICEIRTSVKLAPLS